MIRSAAVAAIAVLVVAAGGCRAGKGPPATETVDQVARRPPAPRPAPQTPAPPALPENPWFPPTDWPERRVPEDFRIGAVHDGVTDEAVYGSLSRLCEELVHGRIEESAIDPARSAVLTNALAKALEGGKRPADFRVGRLVRPSDADAWAKVRFFWAGGSAEGEAYLVRLREGWFVSDLQIDFAPRAARAGDPFLPSPYRGKAE